MAWQSTPGILILVGSFSGIGLLMPVVNWVFLGRDRRFGTKGVEYYYDKRDDYIKNHYKDFEARYGEYRSLPKFPDVPAPARSNPPPGGGGTLKGS